MLKLSNQEFKTTTIIYAKGSSEEIRQHARTDGRCKQRGGNSKKESKINARDQKHCNRK